MPNTNRMKRSIWMLAATIVLPACMTTQPPPDPVNEDGSIHFEGFASEPNALVTLQAYNRFTEEWTPVGTTFGTANQLIFGGRELYQWEMDWTFSDAVPTESWRECYWSADCNAPWGGTTRFRTLEPLGESYVQFTFRPGGLDCTIQRVIQEFEDLETAYVNCHPEEMPNEIAIIFHADHPYP